MKKVLFIFPLLFLITCTLPVFALETGGEVETIFRGSYRKGEWNQELEEKLNLELFLPASGDTEARLEVDIRGGNTKSFTTFVKKLYIKHKADKFNLTAGRQPVSWSFGSLINPVDYNTGAEILDEETSLKFQDAVTTYFPVNWNTGIEVIGSFPEEENKQDIKYGLRYRTGVRGYDLSFNYVNEPEHGSGDRLGFSFKGDLHQAGFYGAIGYRENNKNREQSSVNYLIGGDYSWETNNLNKINLQLELAEMELTHIPVEADSYFGEDNLKLVLSNINYQIDEFSSFNLITAYTSSSDLILIPGYQNQWGENLQFNLETVLLKDGISDDNGINGTLEAGLSYAF